MTDKPTTDALAFFDDLLTYKFPYLQIPSISIAVAKNSKVIYAKAIGQADIAKDIAASRDTIYRVASNSKMFTAVAIMQLQEKQLLRLDDAAITYVPWLADHQDQRWSQVTIRQLLSHSAGMIRDSSRSGYWGLQHPFPNDEAFKEVVLNDSLVFDPNITMKYSNYGFGLLGLIIANVSGVSYADYVTKHIITILKLKNTYPDYSDAIKHKVATGYAGKTPTGIRLPIESSQTNSLMAATGFCSTPSDMSLFATELYNDSTLLLSIESKREMQRIHSKARYGRGTKQFYGLGLGSGDINGKTAYGHGGGYPGHLTETLFIPEMDISICVIINTRGVGPARFAKTIIECIRWFANNHVKSPKHDLTKFTARTGTIWGEIDTIGYGNSIISSFTDIPFDFENAERLTRVNDTTVKITNTSSFAGPGETMQYIYKDSGALDYIDDQGLKIYPAAVRDKEWETLNSISLPRE